jgi:hypothetical protein
MDSHPAFSGTKIVRSFLFRNWPPSDRSRQMLGQFGLSQAICLRRKRNSRPLIGSSFSTMWDSSVQSADIHNVQHRAVIRHLLGDPVKKEDVVATAFAIVVRLRKELPSLDEEIARSFDVFQFDRHKK